MSERDFLFRDSRNAMIHDLIVVGAGPAGLSCALEARKAGLSCLVVDKGNVVSSIEHFQRNMFFFSTPELLEIGGIPFVISTVRPTSLDCVNYYRRVADTHGLEFSIFHPVSKVQPENGQFILSSEL